MERQTPQPRRKGGMLTGVAGAVVIVFGTLLVPSSAIADLRALVRAGQLDDARLDGVGLGDAYEAPSKPDIVLARNERHTSDARSKDKNRHDERDYGKRDYGKRDYGKRDYGTRGGKYGDKYGDRRDRNYGDRRDGKWGGKPDGKYGKGDRHRDRTGDKVGKKDRKDRKDEEQRDVASDEQPNRRSSDPPGSESPRSAPPPDSTEPDDDEPDSSQPDNSPPEQPGAIDTAVDDRDPDGRTDLGTFPLPPAPLPETLADLFRSQPAASPGPGLTTATSGPASPPGIAASSIADPVVDPVTRASGPAFAERSLDDAAQRAAALGGLSGDPSSGGAGSGVTAALSALTGFADTISFDETVEVAGAVLGSALSDPDPRVRQRAAAALGRVNMAVAQVIPVVFTALCSRDVRVQKRAAIILAGLEGYAADVVPALSERVASGDEPAVTRASVQALGNLGVYAIGGLPTLVGALEHDDLGVRYYAGDSVGSVDDQMTAAADAVRKIGLRCGEPSGVAVQNLAARLQPDRAAYRQQAREALAGIAPAARTEVAALDAQLQQGPPENRQRVVQGLSDAARFSSAAVASLAKGASAPGDGWDVAVGARPLTAALDDAEGEVRQTATVGIREASREVTVAATTLEEVPRFDPAVRRAANRALATIDDYAAVTVPGLLDALKDEDAEVRRAAAQAIGERGPQAGMTAPALVDAVKSELAPVSAEAALALARIHGDPATAVPTLVEALDHPEPAVRYQAARALGLLGGDASLALPKLQAALEQPDPAMRYQAVRALTAVDPTAVNGRVDGASEQEIAELLREIKSPDPATRRRASEVLSHLGPAAVATLPYMASELVGAPPATRQEIAWTMQDITASALADVPALIEEMRAGGPGADRAAQILGELGANANLAKRDLIAALDDPDRDVRLTVAELLGGISDYTAQVIGALMVEALEQDEQALAALEQHAAGG